MRLPEQLEEYRNRKIWVCYARVQVKDRITKPPVDPFTLRNAGSTNSNTWATFDEAVAQIGKTATLWLDNEKKNVQVEVAGVGINLETTELLGLDIDHCIERDENRKVVETETLRKARNFWQRVDSYTEISPSGTGVHILVKAKNTNPDLNKNGLPKGLKDIVPGYELYDNGRYFTVTGNALQGCKGIQERQGVVDQIIKEWRELREKSKVSSSVVSSKNTGERVEAPESNIDLWVKMYNSEKGIEIRELYNGDLTRYGGDHSRADQALCDHLAYWTNCNRARMDAMFRESALMREKWNRDDYRNSTLDKAIADRPVFTGYTKEEKKAYAQKKQAEEQRAKKADRGISDILKIIKRG